MTILAFYKVGNKLGWERDHFDIGSHEDNFRDLWKNRVALGAHFYDIESFRYDDAYGTGQHLLNGDDFELDYNDELLDDGGYWVKVLHLPSDYVREVIK